MPQQDDVSNDFHTANAPLSNEAFNQQLAEAEQLDLEPISVTAKRIPDDGSLDDLGNPVDPPVIHTDLVAGKLGDPFEMDYAADMAQGAFIGAKSGATEFVNTLANVTDFLAPDAWTKDPDYFTKMAEEFRPSLKEGDTEWQGFKTPTTQVGNVTKSITQFMVGFLPAVKAMRGIKAIPTVGAGIPAAVKSMAGMGTAGVMADFSMFNPDDKRLSNAAVDGGKSLAASKDEMLSTFAPMERKLADFVVGLGVKGLDNAFTQWAAHDDADSQLLGRVKQAAEGYVVGKVLTPFIALLGAFKKAKVAHVQEAHLDNTMDTLDTVDSAGIPTSTPRFTLKEPTVVVPDEAAQADFAKSYLDGDYEGAAQKASGLINLKYINTEDGIKDLIEQIAVMRDGALGKHTRSWEEAARIAQGLGADSSVELGARVKNLDAYVLKQQEAVVTVAYKVSDLARRHAASPTDVSRLEYADAVNKLVYIDALAAGNRAEITRAARIMAKPNAGGKMAAGIIAQAKNSIGLGTPDWDTVAEMMAHMPNSVGVTQLAKATGVPNWGNALNEVWINAFFSIKTAVVNLSSTGLSTVNTVADRYAGAYNSFVKGTDAADGVTFTEANSYAGNLAKGLFDPKKLASNIKETPFPTSASWTEAQTYAYGLTKGISEMVSAFSTAWKTNAPVLGQSSQVLEGNTFGSFNGAAFGIKDGDAPLMMKLGKALDLTGVALRSVPGGTRSLLASDEFFKGGLYKAEIHALSVREAQKAGLKRGTPEYAARVSEIVDGAKTAKPGEPYHGISLSALKFAEVNTFTEKLGEAGSTIIEGIRMVPGSYAILPFAKSITNLIKWMPRRTPGLAGFSSHMQAELNAGGARADLAEAQIGMGTLWLTAGMGLSTAGYLRGEVTDNLKAKDNLAAFGVEQQAALDPETGEQTAIGRLDGSPVSFLLFAATVRETIEAYIEEHQDEMKPEELEDGIMSIMAIPIGVGAKLTLSKSWTQGITQLIDAFKNDTYDKYGQKLAGNLLPAANTVKWVNTTFFDPYMREADNALEEIISKIPGLSRSLPPRPDPLGNPREHKKLDGYGTNPITQSIPDDSPVMTELRRLQLKEPNTIIMGSVKRDLDMVKFDPVEKWNYMQFVRHIKDDEGRDLVDSLEDVMASEDYNSPTVTDAARNDFLKAMYNKRKDLADKAIQYDSLAFSQGQERPYATEYDLWDYKRTTPLASKLATKQFTKAQKLFGNVGKTRQEFIDERNDEIVKSNLGIELK